MVVFCFFSLVRELALCTCCAERLDDFHNGQDANTVCCIFHWYQHCWHEQFFITHAHTNGFSLHHLHLSPNSFSCTLKWFGVIDGDDFEVIQSWADVRLAATCMCGISVSCCCRKHIIVSITQVYSTRTCFRALIINALFFPSVFCLYLQRYIAFEDSQDGEKKDLQCRLLTVEAHTRQLELKTKNYADQSKSIVLYICHTHGYNWTGSIIAKYNTLTNTSQKPCEQHRQVLWPFVCLMCQRAYGLWCSHWIKASSNIY